MSDARPRFFFDFVDPGSYLMDLRLEGLAAGEDRTVEHVPLELRPPPESMLDPGHPAWREYWDRTAGELALEGIRIVRPRLVPWTRKAHELVLHAADSGLQGAVRRGLFRRYHEAGEDIGRVDVLLEVAAEYGLDRTETKAVLDVDRFASAVEALRLAAGEQRVRGVPSLSFDGRVLEGIHTIDAVQAFLEGGADAR
jgi:predicted DsbA family dithiol-disulfide isomerase